MPGDTFQEGPIPSGNQYIDLLYGAVFNAEGYFRTDGHSLVAALQCPYHLQC